MCLLYLQFLLLLGLPLPDNVLYSCFPCCFLLRSLGRDSYRLLTGANWLLASAVRQSIGAFRDTSRCICLLLPDDTFYCCFPSRFLLGRICEFFYGFRSIFIASSTNRVSTVNLR